MKKNIKKISNLTFALMVFATMTFGSNVFAYGISDVHTNDVATQTAAAPGDIRQGAGQASNHTIEFTLDATVGEETTITENETIVLTFRSGSDAGEFFGNLAAASLDFDDIDLTIGGTGQTCAAAASATDWGCAVTTDAAAGVDGVITLTSPTGAATYGAAGDEVVIEIGNGTTGAVQLINPTVASKDAAVGEADAVEANMYKITVTGTFGTEGGIAHGIKAATIWPVLDEDQVHVYAYVAPELTFDLDSGDTSFNNGNDTSLSQAGGGTEDDDDTALDFFDEFANSIDFGMPTSTAVTYATPTHPNFVMDGGDSASNIDDGGAHGFHVGTNATGGLVTTVWGETLTNPSGETIDAIGAAAAASVPGTEQFGFCLDIDNTVDNATSTYPTDSSDLTDGLADAVIADADFDCGGTGYAFEATASGAGTPTLNTIASSTGPVAMTWFDVEYITNISALTEAGLYQTDLTFITTGMF